MGLTAGGTGLGGGVGFGLTTGSTTGGFGLGLGVASMNFDWKRPLAPILLVAGLFICVSRDPIVGLGLFLVSFALILGFGRGAS